MPVPWGEMRGKVWGPDHGRPVLCLHGWADNCGTFNTLIPLLPKGNLKSDCLFYLFNEGKDLNECKLLYDIVRVRTLSLFISLNLSVHTEYRYVAVDLPGHGQSSHRPPGVFYSFPAYLADVRRVIEGV